MERILDGREGRGKKKREKRGGIGWVIKRKDQMGEACQATKLGLDAHDQVFIATADKRNFAPVGSLAHSKLT